MVALDVDQDQNHTQGRYDGAWLIFNVINHFILLFFFHLFQWFCYLRIQIPKDAK